jgi:vacuolar-type H+-ATPase subunit I/STV1
MKISKATLEQIIREELEEITSENKYLDALLGFAGQRRNTTQVDRPDPVMPQELGPEDDPEREEEELPEVSQQEAIDAFIDAFLGLPKEKQMSWRSDENKEKLNYVLNQFIRNYQMGAIDGTPEDLDGIWNALNEGYEHEGSMARNQLGRTAELATMIQGMISDDTNLEEWVESKITKAQDYLSSVLNYMRGEGLSEAFKTKYDRYEDEEKKIKTPAAKLVREIEKIQSRINFEKNYIPNDRSYSDERKAQAKENIKELEAKLAKKQEELRKLREQ